MYKQPKDETVELWDCWLVQAMAEQMKWTQMAVREVLTGEMRLNLLYHLPTFIAFAVRDALVKLEKMRGAQDQLSEKEKQLLKDIYAFGNSTVGKLVDVGDMLPEADDLSVLEEVRALQSDRKWSTSISDEYSKRLSQLVMHKERPLRPQHPPLPFQNEPKVHYDFTTDRPGGGGRKRALRNMQRYSPSPPFSPVYEPPSKRQRRESPPGNENRRRGKRGAKSREKARASKASKAKKRGIYELSDLEEENRSKKKRKKS